MSLFHLGLLALSYLSGCNQPRPEDSNVPDDTSDPSNCVDDDGDGYSTGSDCTLAVSKPSDEDCDDGNASVHPGAEEVCDEADNNCNGDIDEGNVCSVDDDDDGDGVVNADDCAPNDETRWQEFDGYADADGDGYTSGGLQSVCSGEVLRAGYLAEATEEEDCDDADVTTYPGAFQRMNEGKANDCREPEVVDLWAEEDAIRFGYLTTYTLGDITCDGKQDLVTPSDYGILVFSDVYHNPKFVPGNTITESDADFAVTTDSSNNIGNPQVRDLTGDGCDDLVFASAHAETTEDVLVSTVVYPGPIDESLYLSSAFLNDVEQVADAGISITLAGDDFYLADDVDGYQANGAEWISWSDGAAVVVGALDTTPGIHRYTADHVATLMGGAYGVLGSTAPAIGQVVELDEDVVEHKQYADVLVADVNWDVAGLFCGGTEWQEAHGSEYTTSILEGHGYNQTLEGFGVPYTLFYGNDLGMAVGVGGDLDGDGGVDLMAFSQDYMYIVWSGASALCSNNEITLDPTVIGDQYSAYPLDEDLLATIDTDVTGNGYSVLLAGLPDSAQVYLSAYTGTQAQSKGSHINPIQVIYGDVAGFGGYMSGVLDINGDGYDDKVVGGDEAPDALFLGGPGL